MSTGGARRRILNTNSTCNPVIKQIGQGRGEGITG